MRSPEPLISHPRPGPPPPDEPSTSTAGTQLPGPLPSPILKSSSHRRTHSRSYSHETVSFAEILRQSSRPVDLDHNGLAPSSTQPPPNLLRLSTRRNSERLGSHRDLSDDEARFIYINEPARTHGTLKFVNNEISTSKYTVITFLPRNLFEQFHRLAYIYFLVLAVLNFVPQLGVFSPITGILPLAFVLVVTAVKDAYEDFRRHRSDKTENHRTAAVLTSGEFQPKMWKDIQVSNFFSSSDFLILQLDSFAQLILIWDPDLD